MQDDDAFKPCTLRQLPGALSLAAARIAVDHNPLNAVLREFVAALPEADAILEPQRLAVMTSKMWRNGGVKLGVGFMEQTTVELANRILSHMNAWSQWANVSFALSNVNPQVRITRGGDSYWSYLGVDVLSVPANEPTMMLAGVTMRTSDAECRRVIRHETGHTLGFPHEHFLPEIIALLDAEKVIRGYMDSQGWTREDVIAQVLTPPRAGSYRMTAHADTRSIMCYMIEAWMTKNGVAIPGGNDIDELDAAFAASVYPKPAPPVQPPPVLGEGSGEITIGGVKYRLAATKAG